MPELYRNCRVSRPRLIAPTVSIPCHCSGTGSSALTCRFMSVYVGNWTAVSVFRRCVSPATVKPLYSSKVGLVGLVGLFSALYINW
jgi:hypothetical protein